MANRILDEEPKTNADAAGRERVGDYQRDTDLKGTVLAESFPVKTSETPEDTDE